MHQKDQSFIRYMLKRSKLYLIYVKKVESLLDIY